MCLGIPGRIESIEDGIAPTLRSGRVRFGGITREVNLALTPEADVGDYVIVHAGCAISRLDEQEAGIVLDLIDEAGAVGGETPLV